jgi:anti-sigma B factor antagonist
MPLEIKQTQVAPGVTVVSLTGKLMMGTVGEEIVTLVDGLLREGKRTIVFDLAEVTTLDSTGIGQFISSFNRIMAAGGQMRMAGASGHIFQTFHVSRLDKVFPFYATVEEAGKV